MAYFPAKDMVLEVQSGSPLTYGAIGVLRNVQLQIQNSEEDVSTKGDNQHRRLYPEGAQKSYTITGEFVVSDDAGFSVLRTAAEAMNTGLLARLDDGVSVYAGTWQITQWQEQGAAFGAVQGSVTLASSGPITITASV